MLRFIQSRSHFRRVLQGCLALLGAVAVLLLLSGKCVSASGTDGLHGYDPDVITLVTGLPAADQATSVTSASPPPFSPAVFQRAREAGERLSRLEPGRRRDAVTTQLIRLLDERPRRRPVERPLLVMPDAGLDKAMKILGTYQAREAVPALARHIDFLPAYAASSGTPLEKLFPAYAALIGMGEISVDELLSVLAIEGSSPKQKRLAAYALVRIRGEQEALALLRRKEREAAEAGRSEVAEHFASAARHVPECEKIPFVFDPELQRDLYHESHQR